MATPQAFVLLTLQNATLSFNGSAQSGMLNLECVTVQIPDTSSPVERDVYLVLRLGSFETPIDPTRVVQKTDSPVARTYTFQSAESDPAMVVSISLPSAPSNELAHLMEDLDTFDSILAQYVDLRGSDHTVDKLGGSDATASGSAGALGDLRGHLVVINEDNGEVVGQFDDSKFKVQEDPELHREGHENDAVIIEVPESRSVEEQDATALQMFIRAVPPDQQDWITKSATAVSHAISQTTNLLLTTITTASDYYMSRSASAAQNSQTKSTSGTSIPAPPSRALVFLTSEQTRKGLAGVHAVSGQAVKVSAKTVTVIDGMIRRAMGSKPKNSRQFVPRSPSPSPSPNAFSPGYSGGVKSPSTATGSHLAPPPAYTGPSSPVDNKPPLPPRRSPSPVAPPLPPRTASGVPDNQAAGVRGPLSRKERVLLSADLILSTFDHETRRLLDKSTETIGNVVGHKYGPEAGQTSMLLAGTARNIGLVYVDMRGIGRRAILRKAGKQFVKGRVSSNREAEHPQPL